MATMMETLIWVERELEELNHWRDENGIPCGQFYSNEIKGIHCAMSQDDYAYVSVSKKEEYIPWQEMYFHSCNLMRAGLSPCYTRSRNPRFRRAASVMFKIEEHIKKHYPA